MPATVARSTPASSRASRQKIQQSSPWVCGGRHTEQRIPQAFAKRLEACLGNDPLVEPEVAVLCTILCQPQTFVPAQAPLRRTNPDKRLPTPFMQNFATWDCDHYECSTIQFFVMDFDAERRLKGVGADLYQQVIQGRHLFSRHALDRSVVGHSTKHNPAFPIAERAQFVRQILSAWAGRLVTAELDPPEFPLAVFAQAKLAADVFGLDHYAMTFATRSTSGRHILPGISFGGKRAPVRAMFRSS